MKSMFRSLRSPRRTSSASSYDELQSVSSIDATSTSTITAGRPSKDPQDPLTIIELFQSRGCDSCPPSNANLLNLTEKSCPPRDNLAPIPSDQAKALLFTYHVTYWDYLGWPDTFAEHAFDERQRDYVCRMKLRSALTPQVIVNGWSSGVGSSKRDLVRVLREGGTGQALPALVSTVHENGNENVVVTVDASHLSGTTDLDVWVVWYDSSRQYVKIGSGENRGKVLPHQNIVKSVQRIGDVRAGQKRLLVMGKGKDGLDGVVLVQDGSGGRLVGAGRISCCAVWV